MLLIIRSTVRGVSLWNIFAESAEEADVLQPLAVHTYARNFLVPEDVAASLPLRDPRVTSPKS